MADVKISMMLEDGGSINKKTTEAKGLNTVLEKTQMLSKTALGGGAMTSKQAMDYGRTRATVGTGAEARDFAKQSEGLSGLVRLYAIYAANLYAAGAAFTALREAAATETMIKGMDQLGARSGIALGTLAKNFSDATGGAISLRESAEATTKAISSGLSQKQFLQLGEVAKKASQSLGINMSDAVSRLTRGITKLEPELLDELGIFAKIGPATEKYANELGKPVAALTDFERRQAFANAVLTEGIDKFGKLDLPTNPYDKLTASLKNLAQSALELVNKALLPLVNVLSQSPAALAGVLGLLGLNLIKQALPAIGQYREELKKTADLSSKIAAEKAQESKAAFVARFQEKARIAEAATQAKEETAAVALTKLEKLRGRDRVSQGIRDIIKDPDMHSYTEKQLKDLDALINKNKSLAKTYGDLAAQIRAAQIAAKDLKVAEEDVAKAKGRTPWYTMAGINERIAKGAASKAERSRIVSGAVEESSVGGLLSSFVKLGKETAASKEMGAVGKAMTLIQGSVGIVTNGIVRLASSLGTAGMVVGVLVGAFTVLDGWLSKTAEQAEKFNKTIDDSTSAIKTYNETFKIIAQDGDPFKTEALMAASNAVQTLKDNFKATTAAYLELQNGIDKSWWDSFTNSIAGFFDKSAGQVYATTQVNNLNSIIAASARYGKEQETIAKLSEAIGAPRYQWAEKIAQDAPKAAKSLKAISPELEKISNSFGEAASLSKKFDDTLKEVKTKQQELLTSLIEQTPAGKYASELLQFAASFKDTLTDSGVAVSRLNALLSEQKNLGLFNPQTAKGLSELTAEVTRLNTANKTVETSIEGTTSQLLKLTAEYDALADKATKSRTRIGTPELTDSEKQRLESLPRDINLLKREIDRLRASKEGIYAEINKLMQDPRLGTAIKQSFSKSVDYMTRELDLAFRKASLSVKQAALSGLTGQGLPGIAQAQRELDKEGINIQRESNQTLKEIAKLNAMSLAIQTQEQVTKMGSNLRSGELQGADKTFKDIADEFTKTITGGGGEKPLIDRIKKFLPEAKSEMTTPLMSMYQSLITMRGTLAKEAQLNAEDEISRQKSIKGIISDGYELQSRGLELSKREIDNKLQSLSLSEQEVGYLTYGQATEKNRLLYLKAELDYKSKVVEAEKELAILSYEAATSGRYTEDFKNELNLRFTRKLNLAAQEKTNALKQAELGYAADDLKNQQALLEYRQKILEINNQIVSITQDTELKALKDSLELEKQRQSLTPQEVRYREAIIRSRETELTFIREQASIELDFKKKSIDLQNRINSISADTPEGQYARSRLSDELEAERRLRNTRLGAITQTRDAARSMNEEMARYTDRQVEYGKIFESTFDKMADALVEFARTGKLNFKDLINSMLADLVRYELKLQMMQMYQSMRPGLMSLIGSLFGTSSGGQFGVTPIGFSGYGGQGYIGGGAAKGAYFTDSYSNWATGASRFAKGGMFTNSIVDSPTLFKFAKGTGLMGEAGPEAIMPLKRDSQGNLGVRGGGGNVEVVVNNYSSEKAEARETVDSRGNRRVEVVVGDMTAGEVTRGGSSTNRAIRGTFGLQPQLIRR